MDDKNTEPDSGSDGADTRLDARDPRPEGTGYTVFYTLLVLFILWLIGNGILTLLGAFQKAAHLH